MSDRKIPTPAFGDHLEAAHPSEDVLELLLTRRSSVANNLAGPGPNAGQLQTIIAAGARVPDHGKLAPWRFITIKGKARSALDRIVLEAFHQDEPQAGEARRAMEAKRFQRAPTVVAVISRVQDNHKIPVWEQQLSAGAVCQNMLIAASALGFAAQWLTEWYAYHPIVTEALGLKSAERIAGFIYIGTAKSAPMERKRPVLTSIVSNWRAP